MKDVTTVWQWLSLSCNMPPLWNTQTIHLPSTYLRELSHIAQIHGGKVSFHYSRHQPYTNCILSQSIVEHQMDFELLKLPPRLLEKIKNTQDAILNKTTQRKDTSCLCEYLSFCDGLGIKAANALPAKRKYFWLGLHLLQTVLQGKLLVQNCWLSGNNMRDVGCIGLGVLVWAGSSRV